MILYLDTSSLVKLYVEEMRSPTITALVGKAQVVATSRVAYVEARAAFARKFREHGLRTADYRNIIQDLDQDWENFFVVDVTDPLVKLAGLYTEKHGLKGYDAVHLASAVILRKNTRRPVTFSCYDERLESAAQKEELYLAE